MSAPINYLGIAQGNQAQAQNTYLSGLSSIVQDARQIQSLKDDQLKQQLLQRKQQEQDAFLQGSQGVDYSDPNSVQAFAQEHPQHTKDIYTHHAYVQELSKEAQQKTSIIAQQGVATLQSGDIQGFSKLLNDNSKLLEEHDVDPNGLLQLAADPNTRQHVLDYLNKIGSLYSGVKQTPISDYQKQELALEKRRVDLYGSEGVRKADQQKLRGLENIIRSETGTPEAKQQASDDYYQISGTRLNPDTVTGSLPKGFATKVFTNLTNSADASRGISRGLDIINEIDATKGNLAKGELENKTKELFRFLGAKNSLNANLSTVIAANADDVAANLSQLTGGQVSIPKFEAILRSLNNPDTKSLKAARSILAGVFEKNAAVHNRNYDLLNKNSPNLTEGFNRIDSYQYTPRVFEKEQKDFGLPSEQTKGSSSSQYRTATLPNGQKVRIRQ